MLGATNFLSFVGFDRRRNNKPSIAAPRISSAQVLLRVLRQVRPLWPQLAAILALTFLSTPLALLLPIPLKIVVDSVIGNARAPQFLTSILPAAWSQTGFGVLVAAAGLLLLIGVLMQAQVLASWMVQTYAGERMVHDFRSKL